jgi:hypothetical protein
MREFWRRTFLLPRIALACAGVAVVLNLASYAGLQMRGLGASFALIHVVLIALALVLMVRAVYHRWLALQNSGNVPTRVPIPPALIWATILSFIYFLLLFFGMFAHYGEGGAEVRGAQEVWVVRDRVTGILAPGSVARFEARSLRVFSAAWLFLGLLIAVVGHRIEDRIRAYRAIAR